MVGVVDRAPQRCQRDAGDDLREEIDRAEELPSFRLAREDDRHDHRQRYLDETGYQGPDDIVGYRADKGLVLKQESKVFNGIVGRS